MIFATPQKYLMWHTVHKEWLGKAFLVLEDPEGNQALFTFDEHARADHRCEEVRYLKLSRDPKAVAVSEAPYRQQACGTRSVPLNLHRNTVTDRDDSCSYAPAKQPGSCITEKTDLVALN